MAGMSQDPARRGLGRGLELLMGHSTVEAELVQLPVGSIAPGQFQPRRRFDSDALAELTESIRLQGVVQPVVVRPLTDGYELIAGERRWRAAQAAGLATIPAIVREGDDTEALMLALVENVVREDLSPVEEARGYAALVEDFDLGLGDIAAKVGRSKSSVSNRIRLLELPDDVLELLELRKLTEGHGARRARRSRSRGAAPTRATHRAGRSLRSRRRAGCQVGRCSPALA